MVLVVAIAICMMLMVNLKAVFGHKAGWVG